MPKAQSGRVRSLALVAVATLALGATNVQAQALPKSIKAIDSPFDASPATHFLLGSPAGVAFALDPDKPRADGLLKRVGC